MDLDLSRFAGDDTAAPKTKKGWEWKPIAPQWEGLVLAFDQTLAHTGWALLDCSHKDRDLNRIIIPKAVGTIDTDSSNKGTLGNLLRSEIVFAQAMTLIAGVCKMGLPVRLAHETPPSGGGKLSRPESSLMAAEAIRIAARLQGFEDIRMIHAQSAKGRLTGDRGADKKVVHDVLYSEFPILREMKPNNENTRDAVAVGVLAAEEA